NRHIRPAHPHAERFCLQPWQLAIPAGLPLHHGGARPRHHGAVHHATDFQGQAGRCQPLASGQHLLAKPTHGPTGLRPRRAHWRRPVSRVRALLGTRPRAARQPPKVEVRSPAAAPQHP
ncbi:unnamed protein product, partial [Prorocentrum cordatum]